MATRTIGKIINLPTKTKPMVVVPPGPSFASQVMVGIIVGMVLIYYQESRRSRRRG